MTLNYSNILKVWKLHGDVATKGVPILSIERQGSGPLL
jgi:hypothetical protein